MTIKGPCRTCNRTSVLNEHKGTCDKCTNHDEKENQKMTEKVWNVGDWVRINGGIVCQILSVKSEKTSEALVYGYTCRLWTRVQDGSYVMSRRVFSIEPCEIIAEATPITENRG